VQHSRYAQIFNKAQTVIKVSQACMMQGRAKKEKKPMTEEVVCAVVDIAKNILGIVVNSSNETRQFNNDHKDTISTINYIAGLKHIKIIFKEKAIIRHFSVNIQPLVGVKT